MTHQDKIDFLLRHMDTLGVPRSTAAPPVWRMFWRLGVPATPPLFLGFLTLTLCISLLFAFSWGILIWLASSLWTDFPVSILILSGGAVLAGLFFGLFMAAHFRTIAKRHNLGPWSEYVGARAQA
jgi:Family of unknown function (DUF6404)